MYAAASEVNEDQEFDNPEWKYVSLTLLVKNDTLTGYDNEVDDMLTYELVDDLVDDIYSIVEVDEDNSVATETVETANVETENVEVSNLRKRTRLHNDNKQLSN